MKRKNLQFESGFRVVLGNAGSQAAEMVLSPGDAPVAVHDGGFIEGPESNAECLWNAFVGSLFLLKLF